MKRSEINQALREMEAMIRKCGFPVSPFCGFIPEDWQKLGHKYDKIRDNLLGWNITDYGLERCKYTKTYAEKLL